jgi:hypothetical protein
MNLFASQNNVNFLLGDALLASFPTRTLFCASPSLPSGTGRDLNFTV